MKRFTESKPSIDDIVEALLRDAGTIDLRGNEARLFIQTVRRLAEGQPLTSQHVTDIAADVGLSKKQADAVLNWLAEPNEEGDIVGLAGLSLNRWNHDFEINGRHFSTWCALDTLYLPQIIRKDAKIQSVDPITDEKIHVLLMLYNGHKGRINLIEVKGYDDTGRIYGRTRRGVRRPLVPAHRRRLLFGPDHCRTAVG